MGTSDQTPPKHHKKDDGTTPAPASTPADNGASNTGPLDQTQHKHRKDSTTSDQTMQSTPPGGNTTSTDNGANNMGTSDQTPKHHKANNAMPAGSRRAAKRRQRCNINPAHAEHENLRQDDQSAPKPKKKDKNKTDDQQDKFATIDL